MKTWKEAIDALCREGGSTDIDWTQEGGGFGRRQPVTQKVTGFVAMTVKGNRLEVKGDLYPKNCIPIRMAGSTTGRQMCHTVKCSKCKDEFEKCTPCIPD